jgi:hypothetical protein
MHPSARRDGKVPTLMVFGDYTEGTSGPNGDERCKVCNESVSAINDAGGVGARPRSET